MTDEPANEEFDAVPEGEGEDIFNPFELLAARPEPTCNTKPDTAQGVADLLATTRKHVEDQAFARFGAVYGNDGRFAELVQFPDGRYEFVPQDVLDKQSDRPRFRKGTANFTSLDSFIAHVSRFGDGDSAVFVNDSREAPSLTAVLDYHRTDRLCGGDDRGSTGRVHGEYRHGWHRSSFTFPVSDEWKAWHNTNGKVMEMAEFADFLENNLLDIAEVDKVPESAARFVQSNGGEKLIADWQTLTKLAKSLRIDENSTVSQVNNMASGEGELIVSNTHDAEVGGVKIKVPTMFFIDIPIFREGPLYRLPVRLRYRKRNGVTFWYELWRSDRSFTHALTEAVAKVDASTEAQVFYGSPETRYGSPETR